MLNLGSCDRHEAARALTAWYQAGTRALLTLCAHCCNAHDLALTEQGFELSIDRREELHVNRLQGAL